MSLENMEDDFGMHINDTIPIARNGGKQDEDKPLQNDNRASNKLSMHSSQAAAKYRNLDGSESSDPTKISNVHLEFASGNGSVWSIPSSSASTPVHNIKWYRHPKVREHWKVVLASFVLFFIGLCLCVIGIILEALEVQTSCSGIKKLPASVPISYSPAMLQFLGKTTLALMWLDLTLMLLTEVGGVCSKTKPVGGIFMLFVIGVFCFIPGVYHVIAVYYAVKGKRGFSFYNLPLFN